MTTTETSRYRGYDILPRCQWSQWCVSVYPTRSDLPILSLSTLRSLTPRKNPGALSHPASRFALRQCLAASRRLGLPNRFPAATSSRTRQASRWPTSYGRLIKLRTAAAPSFAARLAVARLSEVPSFAARLAVARLSEVPSFAVRLGAPRVAAAK